MNRIPINGMVGVQKNINSISFQAVVSYLQYFSNSIYTYMYIHITILYMKNSKYAFNLAYNTVQLRLDI